MQNEEFVLHHIYEIGSNYKFGPRILLQGQYGAMQTFWLQNEGSIKNPDICDEEARHLPLGRRLSRSQTLVIWYFLSLQQHSTDRSQQMHTESTNAQIHKYSNTQIYKYTNTKIHKYTNTQIHKYTNT